MNAPKPARPRNKAARAAAPRRLRTDGFTTLELDTEPLPDLPFAEGVDDILGADLRHRLVSEAAYHHFAERGYADGSEIDDWAQAGDEIDHTPGDFPPYRR